MRISDWSSDVCSSDLAARLTAAARLHGVPEEGVVPHLGSLIEERAGTRLDDLLEGLVGMLGARDQLVGLAHVGLMVLAVMEAQGLSRAVRFQCVLRVGQGGELKGHAVSLFLSLSVRSEQNPTPCGACSSFAMHYRQLASNRKNVV